MRPTAVVQVAFPLALAAAMVVLLIVGVVRQYSPVPFWDMWDGYVGFYLRLLNGDTAAWWDFQNEHRIVLTRTLFFADLAWAGGRGIIPLVSNIVLAMTGAACFCVALWRLTRDWTSLQRLPWYAMIVATLAFWSQAQNFTWAFQPQFFLAFVIPLAAFLSMAEAAGRADTHTPFTIACGLGLLSLGTMANGVLVLPLLTLLSVALKIGRIQCGLIALFAAAGVATARLGFPVSAGGGLLHLAWGQPVAVARYLALYMGSPVGSVLPVTRSTLIVSVVAGVMMLASTLKALLRGWHTRQTEPIRLALAAFSFYVCISAGGTALGRVELGPVSALSGRYTTPVLMAFAANIIVLLPRSWSRRYAWLPTGILLAMLPAQIGTLQSAYDLVQGRMLAAMAIELQINDPIVLHRLFPRSRDVLAIGRAARDAQLGVFAAPPLKGSHELIGRRVLGLSCGGRVTHIDRLPDGNHFRVDASTGRWSTDQTSRIVLLDERDTITGVGLYTHQPDTSDRGTEATGYVSAISSIDPARLRVCLFPS